MSEIRVGYDQDLQKNHDLYQAGFQAGKKHEKPSDATLKLIKGMDNKFDNLKDDLTKFKLEIVKEIAELPDKLECKFAPKWVADAMKFVMGATAIAILGAILSLILK